MLVYLFRYIKMRIQLKLNPDVKIPPELPNVMRAALEHCFERERMQEEWADIRKLQEIKESGND